MECCEVSGVISFTQAIGGWAGRGQCHPAGQDKRQYLQLWQRQQQPNHYRTENNFSIPSLYHTQLLPLLFIMQFLIADIC